MKPTRCIAIVAAVALGLTGLYAQDKPPAKEAGEQVLDQEQLEKQFEETMSGASLVGYFTTDGKEQNQGLKEEKYQLKVVEKLDEKDLWKFEYVYGEGGKALPLVLHVKWAGDTPVITLTDSGVPGFGTFSARVLFFRGQYAGTWSAPDHGGKLFGHVVPANEQAGK